MSMIWYLAAVSSYDTVEEFYGPFRKPERAEAFIARQQRIDALEDDYEPENARRWRVQPINPPSEDVR